MNEINFDDNFKENLEFNDFIIIFEIDKSTLDCESFRIEIIKETFKDCILTKSDKTISIGDIRTNLTKSTHNPENIFFINKRKQ